MLLRGMDLVGTWEQHGMVLSCVHTLADRMEVFCAICEVEPHISSRQLGALSLTFKKNYIPGRTRKKSNAYYTNSGSAPVKQVF